MMPLPCPELRCIGVLTKHPDLDWANICTHCHKGWAVIDGQWVEIINQAEVEDVVDQARKLLNP